MEKGDIYRIHPCLDSTFYKGARLGIVLQANTLQKLPTILIAPISQNVQHISFRPRVEIKGEAVHVVTEQIWPVEANRFGQFVGQLSPEELWRVQEAIKLVLDI